METPRGTQARHGTSRLMIEKFAVEKTSTKLSQHVESKTGSCQVVNVGEATLLTNTLLTNSHFDFLLNVILPSNSDLK